MLHSKSSFRLQLFAVLQLAYLHVKERFNPCYNIVNSTTPATVPILHWLCAFSWKECFVISRCSLNWEYSGPHCCSACWIAKKWSSFDAPADGSGSIFCNWAGERYFSMLHVVSDLTSKSAHQLLWYSKITTWVGRISPWAGCSVYICSDPVCHLGVRQTWNPFT